MSDATCPRSTSPLLKGITRGRTLSNSLPPTDKHEAALAISAAISSYKPEPANSPIDKCIEKDVMMAETQNGVNKTDLRVLQRCQESAGQENATTSHSNVIGVDIDPPKRPSFMDLPVEVRRMIFALVLSPYNPEGYNSMIYSNQGKNPRVLGRGHGQVCRLNRQCYNESISLLYAQTLVFLNHKTMTAFFEERTIRQLAQIRSIRMLTRSTDWAPAIKALVLPPEATLQIDWPIDKSLWKAIGENETLRYRKVELGKTSVPCIEGEGDNVKTVQEIVRWVVFKEITGASTASLSNIKFPSLPTLSYWSGDLAIND